ncbi:cytochrome c [Massilia luteola]|uniref:c-type cytochrome n=1 Tax=Massilia luteola TaxID=3081751 RepID=UPI002ACBDE44|nr:cytochrome c [Massilia sp. Gc5]
MKTVRTTAALCLAALAAAGCARQPDRAPAATTAASAATPAQLGRGKYLAAAADCVACHTAPGGAPFAGGVALKTNFGTIYGTNITPDPDTGIGRWSSDDFYQALTAGKSPHGHLYPAMPYTSYRGMTRADSDAIYGYLMHLAPVKLANRQNDLHFPFNLRFGLVFWNMLFLKDTLPASSHGQSADWVRGRYLANVLGHCNECHTPRGRLGQLDLDRPLAGFALTRWFSSNITPAALAERGWTAGGLQAFLKTGVAPQGSAFGDMYEVVNLSTRHLDDADIKALTVYLLGEPPPAAPARRQVAVDQGKVDAGRRIYLNVCAGCHAVDGAGRPHTAVAMRGNTTVREANAHNLIVTILDGLPEQKLGGLENMQPMPGFAQGMSDADVAALVNYLRATWGDLPADVTPDRVAVLRHP